MSLLNTIISSPITITELLICLASALILGLFTALVFSYKHTNSASFSLTLVLLPVAMTMVVMMINGNLGVAVAVAGSFTLVRFRSIAGTGREISAIFIDMALGVIIGMGYIGIAVIFFAIVAIVIILLTLIHFVESNKEKLIRITIPENYDYENLFDDIFKKYGIKYDILRIKTTNMGSLVDITYHITLSKGTVSKAMLDELRQRNGNLSIMVTNNITEKESL